MIVTMEDKMMMDRIDYEELTEKKLADMRKQMAERDAQVAKQNKEIEALRAELEKFRQESKSDSR